MLRLTVFLTIVIFSFILREYLSLLSLLLVLISGIFFFSQKTLNQVAINLLSILIFAYYLINYGKVITPEVGINFLHNVVLLKFMESRKFRDEVMCVLGTILLVSAGSLFDKTLLYLFFFSLSFIFLVQSLFKLNHLPMFTVKNTRSYIKLSVFTLLLFFIFPRIPNPIPFSLQGSGKGEIGYSPDINISSVAKLVENETTAFWAKLSKPMSRDELYWRGNTLSKTDGWNWAPTTIDQGLIQQTTELHYLERQEYRLFIKTPYFFIIDGASVLISGGHAYQSYETSSFNNSDIPQSGRYYTQMGPLPTHFETRHYQDNNLSPESRQWIKNHFSGNRSIAEITAQYQQFIVEEGFSYSWAPGAIKSFTEFIEKKIGFCTHYASSLALILREKGYSARLISGFQGGRFNAYGGFYEITQNDAHAWVEVHDGERWQRIDPTAFIAPERIIMDYQEVINNDFKNPSKNSRNSNSFSNKWAQILGQWDFEFYQLMDQWDTHAQIKLFSPFNLNRKKLMALSFFSFLLLCFYLIKGGKRKSHPQVLWRVFTRKLESQRLYFKGNYQLLAEEIAESNWDKKEQGIKILELFLQTFYGSRDHSELIKRLLKKINR